MMNDWFSFYDVLSEASGMTKIQTVKDSNIMENSMVLLPTYSIQSYR